MKIVTWNAQGAGDKWLEIAAELNTAKFDMLLLQEVTAPPENAIYRDDYGDCWIYEYRPSGTRSRPGTPWYIVYYKWEQQVGGNKRCSLAAAVRNYEPDLKEVLMLPGDRRPALGIRPGQGWPWIFNLHATSGGGGDKDARDLIDGILQITSIGDENASWLLAGDFNVEPDRMETGFDGAYVVCPPDADTHPTLFSTSGSKSRKLDYAVRSFNLGTSSSCEQYPATSLASDHYPQQLDITAAVPIARRLDKGNGMAVD